MESKAWYTLYSKPHKESQLNAHLQSQGIETFYPVIHVKPVNPRSAKERPYFPQYLFVNVEFEKLGISMLKWAYGASHIVEFDGYPAEVPEQIIEMLRSRIEQIDADNLYEPPALKAGDPVSIIKGPFAGHEAIFDVKLSGKERVQILLNVLGQIVRTKVNVKSIERREVRLEKT